MPYQLGIPYAQDSHTSHQAAIQLRREGRRGEKMRRLLEAYRLAGERGMTDLEASDATGLPLQSICSLRNAAVDCELVTKTEIRIGKYGKPNQAWRSVR
jgi:hypothetical protein